MSEQWPDFNEPVPNNRFSLKKRIIYGIIALIIILGLLAPLSRPFLRSGISRVQTMIRGGDAAPTVVPLVENEAEAATAVPQEEAEPVEQAVEETAVSATDTPEEAEPAPTTPPEPTAEAVAEVDAFPINRIAYINADGDLATISPDGLNDRVLTVGSNFFQFPAWSPNGRFLAAIGISRTNAGVYLFEDDEEILGRPLYTSSDKTPFYLYWAPNSEKISFLAQHDATPMSLRLVDVDNEDVETSDIVLEGGPLYWDWSADSENIFVHSALSDEEQMGFIGAGSGNVVDEAIDAPGAFQAPSLSQNGRFVAYAQLSSGGFSELVINDFETQTQTRERYNGLLAMNWSPTSDKLAYISNASEEGFSSIGPLRLYDAETQEITLLSQQNVIAFFWSPDGQKIAYYTLSNPAGDTEFNASWPPTFAKESLLSKTAVQQQRPAFDLTVVDVNTGDGRTLVTNIELSALFISQFLPFFDQYAMSHALWSPGSDAFLIPFNDSGTSRIAIVATAGGQVRELAEGFVAFWSHQ